MNFKIILTVIVAFLLALTLWLFFWPLVECFYAGNFSPLLGAVPRKQIGFVVGFVLFLAASVSGARLVGV